MNDTTIVRASENGLVNSCYLRSFTKVSDIMRYVGVGHKLVSELKESLGVNSNDVKGLVRRGFLEVV